MDNQDTPKVTQQGSSSCWLFQGHTETGKQILEVVDGTYFQLFTTLVTLITLFSDDVRQIFFPLSADLAFTGLTLFSMIMYFIEMVLLSFLKEGYFLNYYFWLDLISTITMGLDLTWINQILAGGGGVAVTASVAKVARVSRASRIGARAAKLIRVLRLIRILKLYRSASKRFTPDQQKVEKDNRVSQNMGTGPQSRHSMRSENKFVNKRLTRLRQVTRPIVLKPEYEISIRAIHVQDQPNIIVKEARKKTSLMKSQQRPVTGSHKAVGSIKGGAGLEQQRHKAEAQPGSDIQIFIPAETRVGSKVTGEIQKNTVSMIMLILVSIPIFDAETWYNKTNFYEQGIDHLNFVSKNFPTEFSNEALRFIEYGQTISSPLLFFTVSLNQTCCTYPDNYTTYIAASKITPYNPNDHRASDVDLWAPDEDTVIAFNAIEQRRFTSKLNIGRTLFICVLLVVSTLLFSQDIETYALQPIENMIQTVKKIAENPLNAIREIEERNLLLELEDVVQKGQQLEPNILENMIIKIGSLLVIGFGEAGTQIISKVIEEASYINVMIPGHKVMAIFGFCDIRNFTDATEVLQADVMVFVNEIAQICHKVVYTHGGSPNKNIGDAFLLVWKFNEADISPEKSNPKSKNMDLVQSKRVKQLADLAVLSLVRMVAEINKAYSLLKYKNNRALKDRIKNFEGVKMGYGMHVGWAIEGPIGSQYKIDASYLSPIVNISGNLEASTKLYNVPMLITGEMYNLMTDCKENLRKIDRVKMGNEDPVDLYTVDISIKNLMKMVGVDKESDLTKKQKKMARVKTNIARRQLLDDIVVTTVTKEMWSQQDILYLREPFTPDFYEFWNKGLAAYLQGNWPVAMEFFEKTKLVAPDHSDGPSDSLLAFMDEHNNVAPPNWPGYREI